MTYLGLDPSTTCTGACLISKYGKVLATYEARPANKSAQFLEKIDQIEAGLNDWYRKNWVHTCLVQACAVERPFSTGLARLNGALTLQARRMTGTAPLGVIVQNVKKFAGAWPDQSKEAVAEAVKTRWNWTHESHDVVDAFVLAHIARCSVMPDEYEDWQVELARAAKEW